MLSRVDVEKTFQFLSLLFDLSNNMSFGHFEKWDQGSLDGTARTRVLPHFVDQINSRRFDEFFLSKVASEMGPV